MGWAHAQIPKDGIPRVTCRATGGGGGDLVGVMLLAMAGGRLGGWKSCILHAVYEGMGAGGAGACERNPQLDAQPLIR